MGIKKIYVIYDKQTYTADEIRNDLQEERYPYYFLISELAYDAFPDAKDRADIEDSDEVWTFGDVSEYDAYEYALEVGADIWIMK